MSLTDQQWDNLISKNPAYARIRNQSTLVDGFPKEERSIDPRQSRCIHLGQIQERSATCWKKCPHDCDKGHSPARPGIECQTCLDYESEQSEALPKGANPDHVGGLRWPIKFDHHNLAKGIPGYRFNSSIIDYQDGYLFAFRNGWAGSDIYVHRLNKRFEPVGEAIKLDLYHSKGAAFGREDPRLYSDGKSIFIDYIGVMGKPLRTNMMYAKLDENLKVVENHLIQYDQRNAWEKNWQHFFHGGQQYAVYTIAPHKVLKIDGDRATLAYENRIHPKWSGGEMRGGASPLRVGDEYYCFFHASQTVSGVLTYHMGVYTFEAKPPFRITKISTEPILYANENSRPKDQYAAVIFPCGAIIKDNHFVVACGTHDRWSELHVFNKDDLDKKMTRLVPPDWFKYRPDTEDAAIYSAISVHDEYRLNRINLKDVVVIDIGAHIGLFALECLNRGARLVECYEPDERSFSLLESNYANNDNVYTYNQPVWNTTTQMKIGTSKEPSHSYTIPSPKGGALAICIADVIDIFEGEYRKDGAARIMKLDCEGAESGIMQGCWGRLGEFTHVIGEFHSLYAKEICKDVLENSGFIFEDLSGGQSAGIFFSRSKGWSQ